MGVHPGDAVVAVLRADPGGWRVDAAAPTDRLRQVTLHRSGRTVRLVVGPDGCVVVGVDEVVLAEIDASDPYGFVTATLAPLLRAVADGEVVVERHLDRQGRLAGADVTISGTPPPGLLPLHRYRVAPGARGDAGG